LTGYRSTDAMTAVIMRSTNYSVDVDKRWVALMVLFMPLIYSPKSFPHRTRHQCLKLSGHGQISITDDGRPQGIATNFERCRRGLHSMPHTARWETLEQIRSGSQRAWSGDATGSLWNTWKAFAGPVKMPEAKGVADCSWSSDSTPPHWAQPGL